MLDDWGDVPGPETQPILDPSLTEEQVVACYKADAFVCMRKLRDIANFVIEEARKDYEEVTSDFTHNMNAGSYEAGALKKDSRIYPKAREEKKGKKGEPRFDDLRDYGRGRIFGNNPEEVASVCEVINWASYADGRKLPHQALVIDIDDRIQNPTPSGYRSFKATLAIPMSEEESERPYHIVELQVQHYGFEQEIKYHPARNRFGTDSHDTYKHIREMERRFKEGNVTWSTALAKQYGAYIRTCKSIHEQAAEHADLHRYDPSPFRNKRFQMALNQSYGEMEEQEVGVSQELKEPDP